MGDAVAAAATEKATVVATVTPTALATGTGTAVAAAVATLAAVVVAEVEVVPVSSHGLWWPGGRVSLPISGYKVTRGTEPYT